MQTAFLFFCPIDVDVPHPDEKSIMTYVAQFMHKFPALSSQSAGVAAAASTAAIASAADQEDDDGDIFFDQEQNRLSFAPPVKFAGSRLSVASSTGGASTPHSLGHRSFESLTDDVFDLTFESNQVGQLSCNFVFVSIVVFSLWILLIRLSSITSFEYSAEIRNLAGPFNSDMQRSILRVQMNVEFVNISLFGISLGSSRYGCWAIIKRYSDKLFT